MPSRRQAVDGLRAVAALTVLAYHVCATRGLSQAGPVAPLFSELKVGVCVFFVISGFAVYLPYAAALRDGSPLPDWRVYVQRRAIRIVPAYWVALTVAALFGYSALGANAWKFYLLAQIYDPKTVTHGLGPAWSLCVEATFYVLAPLLAAWLSRVARSAGHRRAQSAQLSVLGVMFVASIALRALVCGSVLEPVTTHGYVLMTALPGFLDWFAIGMGLAVLACEVDRRPALGAVLGRLLDAPRRCWFASAALFVLATAVEPDDVFLSRYGVAAHVLMGLAAGLLVLPAAVNRQRAGGATLVDALRHRRVVWLGTISFGIYLWHMPALDAALGGPRDAALTAQPVAGTLLLLIAVAGAAVVLGALSWYGVERPLKRLLARGGARLAPSVAG